MSIQPSKWAIAARQKQLTRVVQPSARLALARVLAHRSAHLTPERAIDNANAIIKALHQLGYDVGPIAMWGTDQPVTPQIGDAFTQALSLLNDMEESGRKPYLPDGEY